MSAPLFDSQEPIRTFDDLHDLDAEFREYASRWIFRGLASVEDPLERELAPSLERALERLGLDRAHRDHGATRWERRLLGEFQRHFHRYSSHVPSDDIEWFAIMRHYGAPSRLLDWTYSFWVGVFFAVERAEVKKPSVLWALPLDEWHEHLKRVNPIAVQLHEIREKGGISPVKMKRREHAAILKESEPWVWPVNPFFLNERLAAQQGLFLLPTDLSRSFVDNLSATQVRGRAGAGPRLRRITLVLDRENLADVYRELFRINVTKTTLFPGLGGFAEHLTTRLAMPEQFVGASLPE